MAGEIRSGDSSGTNKGGVKKTRKMWSLQDRSLVSAHLLKANLAEDGCEEAQLDVGKRLLNECRTDSLDPVTQRENARLSVYWFIKSSEQGNDEATQYLRECYNSGRGITCQNVLDVESCINTPKNEKLTFKAARLLYTKLCNGEDFITSTQLLVRLESKKYEAKVTWFNKNSPTVNRNDINFKPNGSPAFVDEELDTFSHEHLSSLKYRNGVKITMEDLLTTAATFNNGDPLEIAIESNQTKFQDWPLLTPWTFCVTQFLVFAYLMNYISIEASFLSILSILLAWSGYNLVLMKSRLNNFNQWSKVFGSTLKEEVPWNDSKPRAIYVQKHIRPYFRTSLACTILLHAVDSHWGFKTVLILITLVSLESNWTQVHWLEFLLRLVLPATMCIGAFVGNRFSENSHGNNTGDQTENSSWPVLPNYDSTFNLVLHCLAVFTIIVSTLSSTIPRRARSDTESQMNMKPLVNLLHIFYVICWINLYGCACSLTNTEAMVVVTILLVILSIRLHLNGQLPNKILFAVTIAVVGTLMATFASSSSSVADSPVVDDQPSLEPLSWTEYEYHCHRSAWQRQSVAATEMYCAAKYLNRTVNWGGKLSYVKLQEENADDSAAIQVELLLNIGEPDKFSSQSLTETEGDSINWNWIVDLMPSLFNKNLVVDTFAFAPVQVTVSIRKDQPEAIATVLSYRSGDIIKFSGKLIRNPGGFKPGIREVDFLECISCVSGHTKLGMNFKSIESESSTAWKPLQNWIIGMVNTTLVKTKIWLDSSSELFNMSWTL